jgi:N-acetylglucosaminyl-diphospho-decaprenol L-rhamnosyltransferase
MNNLNNLTVIIVTFKTNRVILANCIKSIKNSVKILIIENSEDHLFKEDFEKEYENVQVILSGSNLGYGAGNNLGLKNIKTRYALISNPDVEYNKDFFDKLDPYLNGKVEFSIMGASYNDQKNYLPYGSFDKKNIINSQFDELSLKAVDWIVGCTMIFDTKNINTKNYFDENFFLYFEEVDLCRRIKVKGGKIFCNSKLLITHLGHKGSAATDPEYSIETEMFRNWHLMWSQFYYTKKYKNYLYAFFFMLGKFGRSFFKMIIFTLIYNKKKQTMYYARFMGILNSMLGKKSWYRVRSLFK